MAGRRPEMMVSTCSNELKFMSERERSTKPALNGYTNPDFRELRPVDPSDGVPLSRTRVWDLLGSLQFTGVRWH